MSRAARIIGASIAYASLALAIEPETIALEYSAPEGCPDEMAFTSEVRARTSLVRFSDRAASRRFRVAVEARESAFAGRLEIIDAKGEHTLREIQGVECENVVSVLALVGALAIDPQASTVPSSELSKNPEPAPPTAGARSPVPVTLPPVATAAPRVQPTNPLPPPRVSSPELGPRFAVALGAHATTGPAPKVLIGPALFGEIEWTIDAAWAPLIRLGARAARTGIIGPAFDEAQFSWAVGRVELCPIRLEIGARAAVRPCAFTDLGILVAEGSDTAVDQPRRASRFWSAAGLSGWLRLGLRSGFLATLGGGVETPLTRDAFVFRRPDREVVYAVPALAAHAEVLVGYEFE